MSVATAVQHVASLAAAVSEQDLLERLTRASEAVCAGYYSVALLLGPDGQTAAIAHRGMSAHDVARLPHLPRPLGLVGHVLQGHHLRMEDMSTHPRAVGLPAAHVAMKGLLAVPITVAGRILGGVWLTRPPTQPAFSSDDELSLNALAQQAGAVITALRSAQGTGDVLAALTTDQFLPPPALPSTAEGPTQSLERGQSHEEQPRTGGSEGAPSSAAPHFDTAQIGDPTKKTPPSTGPGGSWQVPPAVAASAVVRRLVASARSILGTQTAFLSALTGTEQVFVVVDATPDAPTLREGDQIQTSQGYCSLMLTGQVPPHIANLAVNPLTAPMPVTAATGALTYCGVPVHLPDGTVYGTLCGLDREANLPIDAQRLQALSTVAALIGSRLAVQAHQHHQLLAEQRRFAPLLSGQRRRTVIQPIIDLQTGTVSGFEALARFSEVTGAPRRPDEVFAQASAVGLGSQLEHAAATSALDLLPLLPQGQYLSINFSPRTLLDPATYELLTAYHLQQVVIEVTEHEHVPSYPALLRALGGLRAGGARLAIDDTGAGFTGLQHLAQLNPDIVKLDMSFVRDIDKDPTRRAVARAVGGFAAEVGATLVAEGIQTSPERSVLEDLGATHGQGYLLGHPAPPHTYTDHLQDAGPMTGTDRLSPREAPQS